MKTKYNHPLLIIIIAIITLGILLLNRSNNSNSTLPEFAIKDTATISKLVISKHQNTISVNKVQNEWYISDNEPASKSFVKLALSTLAQITIKEPVAKSERDHILNHLNNDGTKIEIHNKNKIAKTLYIGHPTADSLGTYAKINDSHIPFIVEIPGFNGYLSKRFPCDSNVWGSKKLLNIELANIKSVSVFNGTSSNESFKIEINENKLTFFDYQNHLINNFNAAKINAFLSEISNKNYKAIIKNNKQLFDSLQFSTPFYSIVIEQFNKSFQSINIYKKASKQTSAFFEKEVQFDPNNFYVISNNKHLYIVNYIEFKSLLKKSSFFMY